MVRTASREAALALSPPTFADTDLTGRIATAGKGTTSVVPKQHNQRRGFSP